MKRISWLAFTVIVGLLAYPRPAQTAQPDKSLAITVTRIDKNETGFLISVELTNHSERTLFLPQASGWLPFNYRPRVNSLDIEQWSDGKTNLPPREQIWPSKRARYFSVGPCRDSVTNDGWIRLTPGEHIADQIQAIDPSSVDYGSSVCPFRFAHLSDKLRVSVTAFTSARWRNDKALRVSSEFPIPPH